MKKIIGIAAILAVVFIATAIKNPNFLTAINLYNTLRWSSIYAFFGIAVAFVIITGGIDLSIGSVIGLVGSVLMVMLVQKQMPVWQGIAAVLGISVAIGLFHGLLITKMRLQPFIVTLCGFLLYRGLARYITNDETGGFGEGFDSMVYLAGGKPFSIPVPGLARPLPIPMPMLIMFALAAVAAIFLNFTIWGRYLLALGRNEQAARYSGINTGRMTLLAYVLCSTITGLAGIIYAMEIKSIQPGGLGEGMELYAIAAAVLGGCSLRGGEGSIIGVVLGAALMQLIYNAINILGIPTHLVQAIIGGVILIGVIVDELVKRFAARRRAVRSSVTDTAPPAPIAGGASS